MSKLTLLQIYMVLFIALIFGGCNIENERRYLYEGELRSIRIDDDSEYHFNTDRIVKHDVQSNYVHVVRKNISHPKLYGLYSRQYKMLEDGSKKIIPSGYGREWSFYFYWKIELPLDYQIQTFDD